MNFVTYLDRMSPKRCIGLLCQLIIILLAVYAGTIYPPDYISNRAIIDYIPSVIPFALILTISIFLMFIKEMRVLYPDELELVDDAPNEAQRKE
jgi:hypothetical protein